MKQQQITIKTSGRGTYDITDKVQTIVKDSSVRSGLCHLFIHHTSASLIVTENADPTVRSDLDRIITRLIPDGDPIYDHDMEGPDDMPAHVRSVLTQTEITVPISNSRCKLGTWQGIYLWEHRIMGHQRHVTVSVIG